MIKNFVQLVEKQIKNVCVLRFVCRNLKAELIFLKKKLSLFSAAQNRQNLKAVCFSQVGDYCNHRVLCCLFALVLPELELLKLSLQPLFQSKFFSVEFCFSKKILNPSGSLFWDLSEFTKGRNPPNRDSYGLTKNRTTPSWDPSGLPKYDPSELGYLQISKKVTLPSYQKSKPRPFRAPS